MANICMSEFIITAEHSALVEFTEKLDNWMNSSKSLYEILKLSEIEFDDSLLVNGGYVNYFDLVDTKLYIDIDFKWSPAIEPIRLILKKYLPEASFVYTAEEPGMCLYMTTNPDYIGKYFFDNFQETSELSETEKILYDSHPEIHCSFSQIAAEKVKEIIHILIPTTKSITKIDTLLTKWEESNFNEMAHFHKWEEGEC